VIKRLGILLALMAIVVTACSSGGSGGATAAPATAASSAGAPSEAAPSEGGSPASAAPGGDAAKLVIWADDKRAAAIKPLAQQWATDNGVTVEVQAITENLTTQFKTASQQGTGPDIVVWAHDAVADFVQNSAIDPVTMPDTSMFDPLAVKGMTYQGQLYGVPYSIENIALIRNTDLAPDCPATMEDLVSAGQALVKDKKVTNIMALQVGQKGDAYHIYPLFTSGGGSFFGTTATGDPDGTNVTVDSAESIAAGQKLFDLGEKGVGALKRSVDDKNAIPLFTGGKTAFLVSGPWAIADIEKAKVNYDVCAIPAFADGKPASPFIGVNGFYLASNGKNKTLAQEFLTSVVPTPEFQSGLYAVDPRRPALTESATAAAADDPNIPKFADAGANGTILPAIPEMGQVWSPFGIAESAIVGGTDPKTALTAAAKAIREGIANQ
jgi:arabinogalactan oligomer / maltooligosaccharide transport system substrate-binding protein